MKILSCLVYLALTLGSFKMAHAAESTECFSVDVGKSLTHASCGVVTAKITLFDCLTADVHKTFSADMNFNCSVSPPKLTLAYNGQMLVAEYESFDQQPDLKVMKTYIVDQKRIPAEKN